MRYLLILILFLSGCLHHTIDPLHAPIAEAQRHGVNINPGGTVNEVKASIHHAYNLSNMRLIRYPFLWGEQEYQANGIFGYLTHFYRELQKFEEVAEVCNEIPVKLILDMHHPIGHVEPANNSYGYETAVFNHEHLRAEFIRQWEDIASRFKDNNCVFGYDIMNEPATSRRNWKSLVKEIVRAIRKRDKKKIIIVESVLGDPNKISSFPRFRGRLKRKLWYSAHIYYPFNITHQGLPENGNIRFPIVKRKYTKAKLKRYVQRLKRFQEQERVPIYIGEFSAAAWAVDGNKLLADWMRIFKEYKWHWTYHSWDEYGIWSPIRTTDACPNPMDISWGHCQLPYDDTRARLLRRFS